MIPRDSSLQAPAKLASSGPVISVRPDVRSHSQLGASQTPAPSKVGLIGVGLVGTALARRFLAGGLEVFGYDVDPERCRELARLGGRSVDAVTELPAVCRYLFLSLPTSRIVSVVLGEIENQLGPERILVDTTTGSPRDAVAAGRRVAARGAVYLDATISGSSQQVATGDAVVMAGGPEEAYTACLGLFEQFSRKSFHLGPHGSGSKMKLVTNLVLGLNRAALAEGLAFADRLDLDLERTLAVLKESAAYSRIMESKGPKMVAGDFQPQARLSQHRKDVDLILQLADESGARVPLSETHRQMLVDAEQAGLGEMDNSAIIRVLESNPSDANR